MSKTKPSLGGYRTVNGYVSAKLRRLETSEHHFAALFELMFSERENIMYEETRGYRLIRRTYGEVRAEILARSRSVCRRLSDLPPQSVVGLYMDNSLDWIEMFWCLLRCGFRPLLMNLRLDDGQLEYALRTADARAVISDGKIFSVPTIPAGELPPDSGEGADPAGDFGEEILLMSSGTSSHLKLCAYSAEEFYHQIRGSYSLICESRRVKRHYEGSIKLLTFLPFYHIFGLVAVYIWFTFFSRTLVRLNDMSPDTILNTVRRHKVTHIFAVPLFWEKVYDGARQAIRQRGEKTEAKFRKGMAIARRIGGVPLLGSAFSKLAFREVREKMFGESIVFLITGGSHISSEVMEFFNAVGYHLADGYGMTEIGITSVELSEKKSVLNACFVGQPMKGMAYRISPEGHLLVSGPAAARYVITDGVKKERQIWFDTMDLAECEHGHYRITGRADDLIVSHSGENLNPNIIEEKLTLPGARSVCLIGAGGGAAKSPVLIVSVSRYLTAERLAELSEGIRARMAECRLSGQIDRVFFTTEPLMAENDFKLNRTRIAADFDAGRLPPAAAQEQREGSGERGAAAAFIAERFAEALGRTPEQIGDDDDFFLDLGGGSLDYLAVMAELEREFEIPFPASAGGCTVRALCASVLKKD